MCKDFKYNVPNPDLDQATQLGSGFVGSSTNLPEFTADMQVEKEYILPKN